MILAALLSTLLFLGTVLVLFFAPGYGLLRLAFRIRSLTFFEELLAAFGLSVGLVNATMLILGHFEIPLTALSITLALLTIILVFYVIGMAYRSWRPDTVEANTGPRLELSKNGALLLFLLFVSTIFIKTIYLRDAVLPTATDLGHHMYWSKVISTTHALPEYAKIDVVTDENGASQVSAPQPIADFIVGEHMPFTAINLISGLDFLSAFPINFLNLINVLSILAYAILAWRISLSLSLGAESSEKILLLTFLFLGPLYTLASPQAKYVSGGVIGNIFGNLFIPLVMFFFVRALSEKKTSFLAFGFSFAFILAYIHHLSTLILVFSLLGGILSALAMRPNEIFETLLDWWRLLRKPEVLGILGAFLLFMIVIALPTYLDTKTIDTALGTPTKATRTGLTFLQTTGTVGMAKIALGLVGLLLLLLPHSRKNYGAAILFGWSIALLIMTLEPNWVFLDIPSDRIGTYLTFPLSLAAAYAVVVIFNFLQGTTEGTGWLIPRQIAFVFFLGIFVFILGNGSYENNGTLLSKSKVTEATQTYAASRYLAERLQPGDMLLKDHNYVSADAWMKLFFMRDYGFPLSRGFFTRYEAGGRRTERCTLQMISIPNTPEGKKCFEETGTNLILVNPQYDAAQFEKSSSFDRIYSSNSIHVYERN